MRAITIEYGPGVPAFADVVDEYGRRCNGLCMGEMLEQVVGLVLQGEARYRMETPEGWEALRRAAFERGRAHAASADPPEGVQTC
jgi:hypothetical protein